MRAVVESLERRLAFSLGMEAGAGIGLVANYFSDPSLTNLAFTRVDPQVNFAWSASPGGSLPADGFSVRWTGKLQPRVSGNHTLFVPGGEPTRLFIDGVLRIDNWNSPAAAEQSVTLSLVEGDLHDIRLEVADLSGPGGAALSWAATGLPRQVIPARQLYPDAGWWTEGLLGADIGAASEGANTSVGGAFTLASRSAGLGPTSDSFRFLHRHISGDAALTARVDSVTGADSRAVLSFRASTAPDAAAVSLLVSPTGAVSLHTRATTGASATTQTLGTPAALPRFFQLIRDDGFFTAYHSPTGADGSWVLLGTTRLPDAPRNLLAGVGVTSGSAAATGTAAVSAVSAIPRTPLGAGLDGVIDWSLGNLFMDLNKQTRPYLDTTVDAAGWPVDDFTAIFQSIPSDNALFYNGVYRLSFNGRVSALHSWGGVSFGPITYNAAANLTTVNVTLNATGPNSPSYFAIIFVDTRRTNTSPVNTGVTNIRLLRPGTTTDPRGIFNSAYFAHFRQFSVIRTMDLGRTNSNPITTWASRPRVTDARYSTERGIPLELKVHLANLTHKDLWVTIPAAADADYITRLAQLLRFGSDGVNPYTSPQANPIWPGLNPDRVVYVEYSNEVWNPMFGQHTINFNAALAEVNAGGSNLNFDGLDPTNSWHQSHFGWRRTARMALTISDAFAAVWGNAEINQRVRPILSGQFGWNHPLQVGLDFLNAVFPNRPMSSYLFGLGAAPYFNMAGGDPPGITPAGVLDSLQVSLDIYANGGYEWLNRQARLNGVRAITYEGGPDTAEFNDPPPGNHVAKYAASLDPRMNTMSQQYLNDWYRQGGDLFMWFIAGPTYWYSRWGTWGLTNRFDNFDSPKIIATTTVAQNPPPRLSVGIPVPQRFDARWQSATPRPTGTGVVAGPSLGGALDYTLRIPRSGTYRLALRAATNGTAERLDIIANGRTLTQVTLTRTGSLSAYTDNLVEINLPEGIVQLRLRVANRVNGFNLSEIAVSAIPAAVAPFAPSGAVATALSPTSIRLDWADNSPDEIGFRVQRALDAAFTSGLVSFNLPAETQTFTDTGLLPGTTYFYRVIARGAAIDSAPSETASAVTQAIAPAPATVTAAQSGPTSVRVEWSDVSGETGFRVERARNAAFTAGLASFEVGANVTSFTETGLVQGLTYFYRVRSLTGGLASAPSTAASVTLVAAPGTAPVGLALGGIRYNHVRITWTSVPATATSVVVQRAVGGGAFTTVGEVPAGTLHFDDRAVAPVTGYQYRLLARNVAGDSVPSAPLAVTTPATPYLVSESFAGTPGTPLAGSAGGLGWAAPWSVTGVAAIQSAPPAPPMSYFDLDVGAGLAAGTAVTATRRLDPAVFAGNTADASGNLVAGPDIWMSALIRFDTAPSIGAAIGLGRNSAGGDTTPIVQVGRLGTGATPFWTLAIPGQLIRLGTPITTGRTHLLVLRLSPASESVDFFLNPSFRWPTTPFATLPARILGGAGALEFGSFMWLGGTGQSSLAAVRFGRSFAAVTPRMLPPAEPAGQPSVPPWELIPHPHAKLVPFEPTQLFSRAPIGGAGDWLRQGSPRDILTSPPHADSSA